MTVPKRLTGYCLAGLALLAVCACAIGPEAKARQHRERADQYMEEGRHREAAIEYQAAIQASPKDAEAIYGLARALERLGQPRESRERLQRVLRISPNHVGACVDLGGLLWASGNYGEALELATRALTADPASADARRLQAKALAGLGKIDEARTAWSKVISGASATAASYLDAANFEAWTGDLGQARALVEEGLHRFPDSAPLLVALADVQSLRGDAREAEASLERARSVEPENPEVYAARARFLYRAGRADEALKWLQSAADRFALDPAKSAEMALHRARILAGRGEIMDATSVLKAAHQANGSHREVAAMLADLLISAGEVQEAKALLPAARGDRPWDRIPRLLEARIYLNEGRSYWALQILEGLVARGDLTVDTHLLYAAALAAEERWGRARREYEMVLRRVPDQVLARFDLAGVLRAQEEYDKALVLLDGLPGPLRQAPKVRLLRAQILLDAGNPEEAQTVVEALRQTDPDNPVLLKAAGDVARAREDAEGAAKLYRRSMELSPKAVEPLLAQAALLKKQSGSRAKIQKLLEDFRKANGDDPRVLNWLAEYYLDQRDLVSALNTAEKSALLEPNYWASRVLRGRILLASGEESKAVVAFEQAIKLNPVHPDAYNYAAQIYWKRGDTARAEETYRRLLDPNPGDPQTANNLANLYLELGRVDEALKLAREAFAGAPKNPAVLDTLGWALESAGRSEDAGPLLESAARQLPDNPEVLLHLSVNLLSRKKRAQAEQLAGRVLELAPGSPLAAKAAEVRGRP